MKLKPILALLLLVPAALPSALRAAPAADGLYARFDTSLGTFWCKLEHTLAPRTVANFVSLTEGSRPWLDYIKSNISRERFYDGLTFHRVVRGFVIQGGSPNGFGNDNPGYTFRDEFHPQLRHSAAGILSMANSGANSNGSQFFITLTNTPSLDDKHSVFGSVVEGLDVVFAIGAVPVTTNDRPVTPVLMQAVTIERRGAAAEAFDPNAVTPPLPVVAWAPMAIGFNANRATVLSFPVEADYAYYVVFGPQLTPRDSWSTSLLGYGAGSGAIAVIPTRSIIGNFQFGFFNLVSASPDR
ncbi:MAG TPA: peptidylprolyl isomerase [Verrucomicrobiota bacterium]|nr:peptidylprolyl isomerase [Verrucomicrobiota bacterium]